MALLNYGSDKMRVDSLVISFALVLVPFGESLPGQITELITEEWELDFPVADAS